MKYLVAALGLVAALSAVADRAAASAELSPALKPLPIIDIPFATADYFEIDGAGNLEIALAEGVADGVPASGPVIVDLFIDYDPADPLGTIDGALFSSDDDGFFLDGLLVDAGYVEDADILQLLFGDLSGSAADAFGPVALVEIFIIEPLLGTSDPFSGFVDGTAYDVAGTVQATIPLPAGLPLLGGALVLIAAIRARRAA